MDQSFKEAKKSDRRTDIVRRKRKCTYREKKEGSHNTSLNNNLVRKKSSFRSCF